MIKKMLVLMLILGGFFVGGLYFLNKKHEPQSLLLQTMYGDFTIHEPVLIDLLQDPAMQRLKKIRQYGTNYYTIKKQEYNRYDHSVGVFVLLRAFGASLNEQIAGLLHDVSHTVFSHGGDFFFNISQLGGNSYQDIIHEDFLNKTNIPSILAKHGITVKDILHKNDSFALMERDLPELCADRLEYNLHGAVVDGILNVDEVQLIVKNLTVDDGKWIFNDPELAKKIAKVPFFFMQEEHGWNNYKGFMSNHFIAQVLKRAVEIKLVTYEDIHYSTDDVVWNKLIQSDDKELQNLLNKALHIDQNIKCVTSDDYDLLVKNKFRGVDPYVKTEQGVIRLTELDADFNAEYCAVKQYMEAGWRIKMIS